MRKSTMELGRNTPVSYLYGIGPKKSEAFARLGIFTLRDLCYHFPRAYENRGNVTRLADVRDGDVCSLILTVANNPSSAQIRRGMIITKLQAFDESGKCNIIYFNAPFVKNATGTVLESPFSHDKLVKMLSDMLPRLDELKKQTLAYAGKEDFCSRARVFADILEKR